MFALIRQVVASIDSQQWRTTSPWSPLFAGAVCVIIQKGKRGMIKMIMSVGSEIGQEKNRLKKMRPLESDIHLRFGLSSQLDWPLRRC